MVRGFRLLVLLMVLAMALAGCGVGTSKPTATTAPTAAAEREPTEEPEEEPTERPTTRPRATAEPEETEEPTEEPSTGGDVDFETFTSTEGDYSIDYPSDWEVTEDSPNVQFQESNDEALVQVTYADIGGTVPIEELADIAVKSMQDQFGDGFQEVGREPQNDGSMRIEFTLDEDPGYDGLIFVEQRGTGFYMLLIAVETEKRNDYVETINEMIFSYTLPEGDAGEPSGGSGDEPVDRLEAFFNDFAGAMSDPSIGDEIVQAEWARQLASYFPPEEQDAMEQEMLLSLQGLGQSVAELQATGADIRFNATIEDLEVNELSNDGTNAEVEIVGGTLNLELVGAMAEALPADQRAQKLPLDDLSGSGSTVQMINIDGVWYLQQ